MEELWWVHALTPSKDPACLLVAWAVVPVGLVTGAFLGGVTVLGSEDPDAVADDEKADGTDRAGPRPASALTFACRGT